MIDDIDTALATVRTDRTNLDTLYATQAAKQAAHDKAQQELQDANNALTAGVAAFEADKQALITAAQNELTSGPPAPTPTPQPTPSPIG